MRLIGFWSHIVVDLFVLILLLIGPRYAGFSGRQADIAWVLAGAVFLLIVFTLIRVLRFAVHGAVEIIIAILILIFPWLANFARGVHSRNFYLFIGVLMIVIWAMTDFRGVRSAGRESNPK